MKRYERKKGIKRSKSKKRNWLIYFFFLLICITVIPVGKAIFSEGRWVSKSKFVIVQPSEKKGDVRVIILDRNYSETTTIIIPSSTEVEVAGNLGKRKIGNVWELGIDEGKEGKLLQRTVETNFLFPIEAWVGPEVDILNSGIGERLLFIIGRGQTNLGMRDRLGIVWFVTSLAGKNTNTELQTSTLIRPVKLSDGSDGYELTGIYSDRIFSYFADEFLSENSYKLMIKKTVSASSQAEMVGKIIEVWGVKPAYMAIDANQKVPDGSCIIYTGNKYIAKKIHNTFGCDIIQKESDVLDAEIIVGENAVKEF